MTCGSQQTLNPFFLLDLTEVVILHICKEFIRIVLSSCICYEITNMIYTFTKIPLIGRNINSNSSNTLKVRNQLSLVREKQKIVSLLKKVKQLTEENVPT